jgi:hypothetical protein
MQADRSRIEQIFAEAVNQSDATARAAKQRPKKPVCRLGMVEILPGFLLLYGDSRI